MHNAHILELQGVENFRDLGGYSTGNGAVVKWGKLFRSGHMANLSEYDCQQLAPLNISALFDLRTPGERDAFPTNWHGERQPNIFTIDLPEDDATTASELFDRIMAGEISRQDVLAHMLEDYARMPFEFSPILKELFARLLEREPGALVIHCTAGKDRTGCVVALLLSMLGVSWEKIVEDYLLSNEGFDSEEKLAHIAKKYRRKADNIDEKIDALRPLLRVEADYLESAFNAIRREMGNIDSYFASILELNDEQIAELRQALLRVNL